MSLPSTIIILWHICHNTLVAKNGKVEVLGTRNYQIAPYAPYKMIKFFPSFHSNRYCLYASKPAATRRTLAPSYVITLPPMPGECRRSPLDASSAVLVSLPLPWPASTGKHALRHQPATGDRRVRSPSSLHQHPPLVEKRLSLTHQNCLSSAHFGSPTTYIRAVMLTAGERYSLSRIKTIPPTHLVCAPG
jgi:hypothetical protein